MCVRIDEVPVDYDPARLEAVRAKLGLKLVVLFGSRATGSPPPAPDSDLDLAVLGSRAGPPLRSWNCYQELAEVFGGVNLDLVLLHGADPLLRYEIMSRGTLLCGDIDEFLEYRAFAFRDFVDSADLRALEETLFRKKMSYLLETRGAS
jgi:predicted nucleotidyltransferase